MEPEKKSNGTLVGLVVIIIILVVGGVYIWMSSKKATEKTQDQPSQTVTTEDSAELDTLDADLQTTDTSTGVDVDVIQ